MTYEFLFVTVYIEITEQRNEVRVLKILLIAARI